MFALTSSELGSTDLVTHSIETGSHSPIRQPVRRTPFALRDTVDKLVQMLEQDVIRPSAFTESMGQPNCAGEEEGQHHAFLCRLPPVELHH